MEVEFYRELRRGLITIARALAKYKGFPWMLYLLGVEDCITIQEVVK